MHTVYDLYRLPTLLAAEGHVMYYIYIPDAILLGLLQVFLSDVRGVWAKARSHFLLGCLNSIRWKKGLTCHEISWTIQHIVICFKPTK